MVKRVAHLECSTCRLWVFADICIHGPPQDVYLDFSSWLGDSLCSSVCFSYLHFLFTHTFIFYVCVWPRRRERQFFQKLNILYLIYIHQGHFHFKFNVLVILIFSKILANLQGFGSTSYIISESVQFSSVVQSCPTLCDPMNRNTPGLPVHHYLPEFTQTHIHRVSDAIQPSHPLSSHSPPAPNPSQHQSLFQ